MLHSVALLSVHYLLADGFIGLPSTLRFVPYYLLWLWHIDELWAWALGRRCVGCSCMLLVLHQVLGVVARGGQSVLQMPQLGDLGAWPLVD